MLTISALCYVEYNEGDDEICLPLLFWNNVVEGRIGIRRDWIIKNHSNNEVIGRATSYPSNPESQWRKMSYSLFTHCDLHSIKVDNGMKFLGFMKTIKEWKDVHRCCWEWLLQNKVVIVCHEKVVEIPLEGSGILKVLGERTLGAIKALMNAKVDEPKLSDISVVQDFVDVFPKDLSGLPPQRQVEFRVDLVPGATPVAQSPYRLAPSEMQ
ncbi:hypothetical protein Tco_0098075 [Tanacetum coccineum]